LLKTQKFAYLAVGVVARKDAKILIREHPIKSVSSVFHYKKRRAIARLCYVKSQ
jgi:hypothetical protein